MGKIAVDGYEAAICASGCAILARRGMKADSDAGGNGPGRGNQQRSIYPQKGRARALQQFHDLRPMDIAQQLHARKAAKATSKLAATMSSTAASPERLRGP